MKFIIATGGTGGHLFPALCVARELKREGHEIVFLGSFSRSWEQIQNSGFAFEELGAKGFTMASIKDSFNSIGAMIKAVVQAVCALRRIRPDVVIGFGGYGAFPAVLSAVMLRYPALIHEQNVVPGRANSILAKFVKRIAISFGKSNKYFNPGKTVLTGCPCHLPKENVDRAAVFKEFHLVEGKTTVLVIGGSQGSRRINEVFLGVAKSLKGKLDFQVIHVSGRQDYQNLHDRYNLLGIPFALFEFLDKMEEAYHIADLVISRSGAVTVSEIASFQLPAIFIPYPYAQGHQKENASVLCDVKAARLIEDKDLSVSKLTDDILEALDRPLNLRDKEQMFKNICFSDATQRLVKEAVHLK